MASSSSVFLLTTVMVACAVCGATPFQKVQLNGGPVDLSQTGSSVAVTCTDGFATLSFTANPQAAVGRTAIIWIGPKADLPVAVPVAEEGLPEGGNGCWSGAEYQVSPTIATSTPNFCGRTLVGENERFYEWAVFVEEQIALPNTLIAEYFTATFIARCAQRAAVPPVVVDLPPPAMEGLADFTAAPIAFELVKGETAPGSRVWTLTLRPKDRAALGGLDYILTQLTATPTGAKQQAGKPEVDFIDEGCIVNGYETTVVRQTTDTLTYDIKIRIFQFIGYAGKGVDFTAEVRLCAEADGCNPVVPDCSAASTRLDSGQTQKRLPHSDTRIRQTGSNIVKTL